MVGFIVVVFILLLVFGKQDEASDFIGGLLSIIIRIGITAVAFGINPILGIIVLFVMFHGSD